MVQIVEAAHVASQPIRPRADPLVSACSYLRWTRADRRHQSGYRAAGAVGAGTQISSSGMADD